MRSSVGRSVGWFGRRAVVGMGSLFLLLGAAAMASSCMNVGAAATPAEPPEIASSAMTPMSSATISGVISDSMGRALSDVSVALNGQQQAVATTGITGTYSFTINMPGSTASVSVKPTKSGCSFDPDVVNLNDITASQTVNFTGTGATCGGVAAPTAVDPGPRAGTRRAGGGATRESGRFDRASAGGRGVPLHRLEHHAGAGADARREARL